MFKRIIPIAVSIAMAFSVSACGSKDTAQKPSATSSVTAGDASQKLTISWLGWPGLTGTPKSDSYIQTYLEKKYNVEIKPIFLDTTAYLQKKPIMMASGDIPDFIFESDPSGLQNDVKQGFLMELPYATIQKNAPGYMKIIKEYAPIAWVGTNVDGKNYGMPTTRVLSNYPSFSGLWRMDWLNNVGITKVPETLDEMHTALLKLTNDDPDKNGKKDTYGMTGDMGSVGAAYYFVFPEIFGSYGVLPFDWMKKDGKIVFGATLPQTKDALATLAQWYKEGIIDPEFVTDSVNKQTVTNKFINGKNGYIAHASAVTDDDTANPNSIISKMKGLGANPALAFSAPPKGPGGQGRFAWGAIGNAVSFGKQCATQPEKVERILKLLNDSLTNEEQFVLTKAGQEGVTYKFNDATVGKSSGITALDPYTDKNTANANCLQYDLTYVSFFNPTGGDMDILGKYLTKKQKDAYNVYQKPEYGISDYFMKPDMEPSAGTYILNLRNSELNAMAQIIRGEKPVSYWDEYIKTWKSQGGDILSSEAQTLGDTAEKIYAQLGIK